MSEETKTEKVTIFSNGTQIEVQREEIIEIKHSHDGIVFNLKNGLHIYATDSFMPPDMKDRIISTFDRFKNADILIDLKNFQTPVSVKVK